MCGGKHFYTNLQKNFKNIIPMIFAVIFFINSFYNIYWVICVFNILLKVLKFNTLLKGNWEVHKANLWHISQKLTKYIKKILSTIKKQRQENVEWGNWLTKA